MRPRHAAALALGFAMTVGCSSQKPTNDTPILQSPFFLRLALHCWGDHVVKECYSPPNIQPPVHCTREADDALLCDVKSGDQMVYARCSSLGCEEAAPPK
jgi:hypothetical protein